MASAAPDLPLLRPRAGVPALEAELFDGSAALDVVWLGRRSITGLTLGSRLTVQGMLGVERGERRIVNPTYEFLPAPEA